LPGDGFGAKLGELSMMTSRRRLDCILIGYNETPFDKYESFLRNYGEDTEAYRDLRYSFIDLGDKKVSYVGLLNNVINSTSEGGKALTAKDEFKSGDIPNLAAIYLVNFLRRRGFEASYINLFQYEKEKLGEYLSQDPLCVGIATTLYVVNQPVSEMVTFIRENNPKVKIVVGGPLIANHSRNYQGEALRAALDDIGADIYVVEGQGEFALSQIVDYLKNGGNLSNIANLIYFENGRLHKTIVLPENNALDENYIDWRQFPEQNLGSTIQTRTARSCAFRCAFCNYPTRAGKLTLADIATVEKELDSLRDLGTVKNVVFIDDTFNVPLLRFKDLCRMMIKNNYDFNWFSYFRCGNADEETFELMAKSKCKGVFLGIESGSPAILKNMNKAATIEQYAKGMKMLRENGILAFGSFIIGFPGETHETVDETIAFIKESKPDYYRAQMWYCEPGTPIDQQRAKHKIEGEGFVWNHATMNSLEAMDQIDRAFLSIGTEESLWLPQWSFDFWILPYLLGRNITFDRLNDFMRLAHKMLAMEIAYVPEHEKRSRQRKYLQSLIDIAKTWRKDLAFTN
jgi:radical SAM PhpK family P-methyltransferase